MRAMHASHVTEGLFYYQGLVDTGAGGRTPILILWLGIDLLVTERLRGEIRAAVESNEQCPETWLVFPAHLGEQVAALIDGEVRDRFANEAGFTYRLISVDGDGGWSETERIGPDTHGIDTRAVSVFAPDLWHNGLRQIFRDTDSLYSSGPAFHFAKPSGAHTSYFLRASETANHNLHASFVAACLLSEVDAVPVRMLSDTAGVHSILFHLRTLLERLRDAPIIPIDSFGGYESFDEWVSLISTDDLIVISSSTSGALARKIVERLGANTPPIVTLYYLSEQIPDAHRTLCDLTFRGDGAFATSGVLGSYYQYLSPSHGLTSDCKLCEQRVPVLQLEGDSFVPRPDGLELRMVTVRVFDRRPIDVDHRGSRAQSAFFSDFYGLDVVHMHADHEDSDRESRRQFRTHIAHLLKESESLGTPFRTELLGIRDSLQESLGMKSIDVFVSTPDVDSIALARWLAAESVGDDAANPTPRVFTRPKLGLRDGDLFDTLASVPPGSNVVGVSSVVSTGRALLDLSRSLRVVPDGVMTGYMAAIGHPPSLNSWQILLNSLRWTAPDLKSDFQFGWLLERDPLEIGAETAWTAELKLAAAVIESEPKGSAAAAAANARIEQVRARPIGSRRLFVDPAFDGVNEVELRPINRGFMAWNFDYLNRDRRDGRRDASQAEVFAAVSHMLHRSRFANADTAAGRLSTRLPGFVLDPANFDRYNDPQIQAAILRSAHPGELDYRSDEDGSRAMTEVVLHSLANLDGEAGAVAAEFVIALLIGLNPTPRSGLSLRPDNQAEVLRRLEQLEQDAQRNMGPYLRSMIRLLPAASDSNRDGGAAD
jgi:hypothetical protein